MDVVKLIDPNGSLSADANLGDVKSIISKAKEIGLNPLDVLAISLQETGLGTRGNPGAYFHLNPDYFNKSSAGVEGVKSVKDQLDYAKSLQKRGVVPQGEDFLLQGYNGYGTVKKGHADLGGATSMYGVPIPDEGLNFKDNPIYGRRIQYIKENILNSNPTIRNLVKP